MYIICGERSFECGRLLLSYSKLVGTKLNFDLDLVGLDNKRLEKISEGRSEARLGSSNQC